jgi:hypothetical protein
MGDFDFWRWARIVAIAAVAGYLLHLVGAVGQSFTHNGVGARITLRLSLLSLGTTANAVSELLLVAGLMLSWGEPDRRLLAVVCGCGAVSAVLAAIGMVDLFTWPDGNAPQRWFDGGTMAAGIVVAVAVTAAAWQWMASLSGGGPAVEAVVGDYVSEPLDSPSGGPDNR